MMNLHSRFISLLCLQFAWTIFVDFFILEVIQYRMMTFLVAHQILIECQYKSTDMKPPKMTMNY